MSGQLFIVATPIGNREDMTYRAVRVLQTVDYIAAEDTRHSFKLSEFHHIDTTMLPFHQHNEAKQTAFLIKQLLAGKNVALISDAGTPLISDPGNTLVSQAHAYGITVVPIPGPCAAIAALSVSGISTCQFTFLGFLPAKPLSRRHALCRLVALSQTLVFYEAPHRLQSTLEDMQVVLGQHRKVALCKEMTKRFETIHCSTLGEVTQWLTQQVCSPARAPKGEWVLVVAGVSESGQSALSFYSSEEVGRIMGILLQRLPPARAAAVAARITGWSRSQLYAMIKSVS